MTAPGLLADRRERCVGALRVVRVPHAGVEEYVLTVSPVADAGLDAAGAFLRERGAVILAQRIFGVPSRMGTDRPVREPFGPVAWPVTRLAGRDGGKGLPGAVRIHAVAGCDVGRIRLDGRVVGSVFRTRNARWCLLGGLVDPRPGRARAAQARAVFEVADRALARAGMDFSHVVRTWFYLDHLLDWYDAFNTVRTAFFREHGVFDGLVPASTGIGAPNAHGAAVIADLLAVEPLTPAATCAPIPSPLQCPALEYGSSFSRAVELRDGDSRRLLVSGTASIAPDGRTRHVGDIERQIALTFEVVHAILRARRMDWRHVFRSIVYLRHGRDLAAFRRYLRAHRLPDLAAVCLESDVCRDDLLFEIELDAVETGRPAG